MIHADHPGARRVYLRGKRHDIYCLVSAEDFEWAMQWAWRYKMDKRGKKFYAVRHGRVYDGPSCKQIDIYLHKAVLRDRMMKRPRSAAHRIGDHGDGDSLNNQRGNLAWATASKNCKTCRIRTPRCERGRFRSPINHQSLVT